MPHPLASEVFKVGGRDIFVAEDGLLVDVLRKKGPTRVNEDTFKSHHGRTFDGLVKHALAGAPSLLPPSGP